MQYPRPPIVEAVVELRWEAELPRKVIDRASRRLESKYPVHEELSEFTIEVKPPSAAVKTAFHGIKRLSADRSDIVVLRPATFSRSRLPPYPGWDGFKTMAQEDWESIRRLLPRSKVSRIGVRYINRIDVPYAGQPVLQNEDYISIFPTTPFGDEPLIQYAINLIRIDKATGCRVTINTGPVAAPLLGYASLILDIDLAREADISQREDELWSLVNTMGNAKSFIFEQCITDKARELFQ
ncbi:MAG: TIGR04255 family protein [Beijerinckiaceae bacterium]